MGVGRSSGKSGGGAQPCVDGSVQALPSIMAMEYERQRRR